MFSPAQRSELALAAQERISLLQCARMTARMARGDADPTVGVLAERIAQLSDAVDQLKRSDAPVHS